ncbi:MAG: DUF255 domain-containing protein [Desulforegulaceae bacterium]|nr:DUF255 domain-containing protein [Desulforegulaceae bacterium]
MRLNFKHLALAVVFVFLTHFSASADEINWLDYKTGSKVSLETDKKMYIYFFSAKCPWCVKMENDTFKNKKVAKYLNKNFTPVKVDVYKDQNTAALYGIGPIPASIFMESDIKTGIYKRPGYIPSDTFIKIIETINLGKYKE